MLQEQINIFDLIKHSIIINNGIMRGLKAHYEYFWLLVDYDSNDAYRFSYLFSIYELMTLLL